jgi:cytoskeletal protein CcmA (bactofilin family)
MRRTQRAGASLLAVLGLVSVLSFLAAAMTALFLHGLHLSQGTFNGDVAFSQAEAGLHEALYRLGADDHCTWGKNNEEIQGSVSTEFPLRDSFYRVTFQRDADVAFSTNNAAGDRPAGYAGRAIGEGNIHLVSNGFCRGQWRVIETVVKKPDAPYGIASSGRIHSKTPLVVYGTRNAQDVDSDNFRRPGHIVSNSAEGIHIERPAGTPAAEKTHVTGFIQSVGPIRVDQPARVDSGLRPHASACELPDFDIQGEFDPGTDPGTVQITELNHGPQELDVIYRSGHDLSFSGPVVLHDAYLYVQGKLQIQGGIRGRGAIVVDGDVEVSGDVQLNGNNNVALLSSGKIRLHGSGNYFQGFVYAEKGIVADNLTVVGSLILNHGATGPEPALELDKVTVINDEQQGRIRFTSQSYSYSTGMSGAAGANALAFNWGQWSAQTGYEGAGSGAIYEHELPGKLVDILGFPGPSQPGGAILDFSTVIDWTQPFPGGPDISPVMAAHQRFVGARQAAPNFLSLQAELADLEGQNLSPGTPEWQEREDLRNRVEDVLNAWADYHALVNKFAEDYTKFVKGYASPNGARRLRPGAAPPDVTRTFEMDLNRYLPASDRLHVAFWRLHSQKF